MARAKKSEGKVIKAASVKKPPSQPAAPPKSAETPEPLAGAKAIAPFEDDFVPFSVETYVSRLTEASEQNSRKTIFAKQIAEKGGIAELAVQMAPSEDDTENQVLEATRRALLYREAEQYVIAELRESGDIESGLLKCKEAWERRKRHENSIAYTHKTDANGKRLPIPLEEGLSVLMPHNVKECRLPYFRQWLTDDCLQQLRAEIATFEKRADNEGLSIREHMEAVAFLIKKRLQADRLRKNSRQLLINVVERRIRKMQRSGIDVRVFERARLTFRDWKAAEVSKTRKASGTKGAEKTNAKPKAKRTARPPVIEEELKEKFEVARKSGLT